MDWTTPHSRTSTFRKINPLLVQGIILIYDKSQPGTVVIVTCKQIFVFIIIIANTVRIRLKQGNYMVIPSTLKANLKGAFMLRLASEKIDLTTEVDMSYSIKQKTKEFADKPGLFKVPASKINGIYILFYD